MKYLVAILSVALLLQAVCAAPSKKEDCAWFNEDCETTADCCQDQRDPVQCIADNSWGSMTFHYCSSAKKVVAASLGIKYTQGCKTANQACGSDADCCHDKRHPFTCVNGACNDEHDDHDDDDK